MRPRRARQEKPRVSAFLDGKVDRIVALQPDLVIGFSDMQAALADKLIRAGLNVLVTNQRSVAEIVATMRLVASWSVPTTARRRGSPAAWHGMPRSTPMRRAGRADRASSSRSGTSR